MRNGKKAPSPFPIHLNSATCSSSGFSVEHANSKGHMIAATIFSASNYPKGAGEPAGNKAAVVVLEPREPGHASRSAPNGRFPGLSEVRNG